MSVGLPTMVRMSPRAAAVSLLRVAGVEAEITYKPITTIRLRVLPPDGRVAVSVPVSVADSAVRSFVESNREWIATAQAKVRLLNPGPEPLDDGGRARLWGRWHEVSVGPGSRPSAGLRGDALVLSGIDEEARRRGLEALYRRELEAALPALREAWEPRVGREASLVRLRRMTTRWGTCNTRSAAITLNVALAEHPPTALEYVLVHELVHLHERGHGPGFVSRMDALLPEWRVRRRALQSRA